MLKKEKKENSDFDDAEAKVEETKQSDLDDEAIEAFEAIETGDIICKDMKEIGSTVIGYYCGAMPDGSALEGYQFKDPATKIIYLVGNYHHIGKFFGEQAEKGADFKNTVYKVTTSAKEPMKGSDKPYYRFSYAKRTK